MYERGPSGTALTPARSAEADRVPRHLGAGVQPLPDLAGNEQHQPVNALGAEAYLFGSNGRQRQGGSSFCWAGPDSGVSFVYLTNRPMPEPGHSRRVDIISTLAHACITDC